METNYFTKEIKNKMLKSFLFISKKFKKYLDKDDVYWIYKISNIVNNKVYIGKTKNIRKRALNYINASIKGDDSSEVLKDMILYGINKFMMSPLEIESNPTSASIKEKYYIDLYNSIESGYNVSMNSSNSHINGRTIGSPQTLYAKTAKSKLMCAVNPDNHEIIFSTGLKLFGDYIGKHKDDIKSFAKRQTKVNGYFIYYLTKTDFQNQVKSAKLKIDKNSIYSDCNLQYPEFIKYSEYIKNIILNINNNPENFKILFITQSNEPCGYKYDDAKKFLEYYELIESRII